MKTNRISFALTSMAVAAVLTACGGGGSGSTNTAVTPPALTCSTGQSPDSTGKNCVVTYVAGSLDSATYSFIGDKYSAGPFNALNVARTQCGFGSVKQNTNLDNAAKAHAKYLVVSSYDDGPHNEVSTKPFFTGATVSDRTKAAAYQSNAVSEGIAGGSIKDYYARNIFGTRSQLVGPYHQLNALRGWRETGMFVADDSDLLPYVNTGKYVGSVYMVINYGIPSGSTSQLLSSTDVSTYPCEGVTGTQTTLYGEIPSVDPTRNYNYGGFPTGQPVAVMVREGQTLAVTSASMKEKVTGVAVPLQKTLTSANDVNHLVRANEAVVIPDVPLKKETAYLVEISGTNSGQPFNKTFTFTTGTQPGA